jgi:hypothetical protein
MHPEESGYADGMQQTLLRLPPNTPSASSALYMLPD